MGEIAEMMLDGTLCESCGDYIGNGEGFPVKCEGCKTQRTDKKFTAKFSASGSARHQSLGEKQIKRLKRIMDYTDKPLGKYPGDYADAAPAKYESLVRAGFAEYYEPHNSIHKTRIVITERGRQFLTEVK